MKKLLSVFNTCGIKRTENVDHYKRAIHSFLNQDLDSHDLLVSACLNDDATKDALIKEFGNSSTTGL